MKRKTILFTLMLFLMTNMAFAATDYVQANLEKIVIESLTKTNITFESVKFDASANTLTLTKLAAKADNLDVAIDEVIFKKPNVESLNPATSGHPLVAEETILKNLVVKSVQNGLPIEQKYGNVRALNWKQNVGKFFTMKDKLYSEEFYTIYLNAYYDSVELNDFTTLTPTVEVPFTIKNITFKNITPTEIGSSVLSGLFIDVKEDASTKFKFSVDSVTIGTFKHFTPKQYANLIQLGKEPEDKQDELMASFGKELLAEMLKGFKASFAVKGLVVQEGSGGKKSVDFKLDEMKFVSAFDPTNAKNLTFNLDFNGFTFDIATYEQDPAVLENVKKALNGTVVTMNYGFHSSINLENKDSNINALAFIKELGEAKSSIDFNLNIKNFGDIFNMEGMEALQVASIRSLKLNYSDGGLIKQFLLAVSKKMEQPPAATVGLLSTVFDAQSKELAPFISAENIGAVKQCLFNPGVLNVDVTFAEPTLLFGVMLAAQLDPLTVPVKITCKPGKPLAEGL